MKNALITGGSGGIATEIAFVLKRNNFEVLKPSKMILNVTDRLSINAFFKLNSNINLLVNNAGCIYTAPLSDSDTWSWENVINVNLLGTYRITREVLRRNKNSTIINISSMSAYQYFENFSAYASAKAGIVAMTKCLAAEGVKAYSICPGGVETPFRKKLAKNTNQPADSSKIEIGGPLLSPFEIAEIVDDILSEKYQNGSSILIRKNDIFEVR